jgi:hypothetical protein
MKTLTTAILLIFFSSVLISCQKEVDFTLPPTTGGGTGSGSGGTPGGTVNTSGAYYPLTTGSFWKYKDSATGVVQTNAVIAATRVINSIIYKGLYTPSTNDTGWMASAQPNYYMAVKGNSPNTGAPYDLVIYYLNDTAAVGWSAESSAGQGNGFAATTKTTIMERGITKVVNGKSYNNVIRTNVTLSYDLMGNAIQMASYQFYVAKGVGIIRAETDIGAFGVSFRSCSELVDYKIN